MVIFVNGLSLSCSYALMAIGLTLIFGVLRVFNFAHGELLMLGAYMVFVLFGITQAPFPVALVGAALFVAGVAMVAELGLFKPTRGEPFRGFILSLGLVYILQVTALQIFGPLPKTAPTFIPGGIEFLGASLITQRLVVIPVVAGVLFAVWSFLERSRTGRAVRACIQDRQAAALQGINLDRMCMIVMLMAGGLAGLAGGLLSQGISITAYFGGLFIMKAFIVVIVGGMGSVGGTLMAAFLFGFLDSTVATLINPRITTMVDIIILLLILAFRPRGLFSR